MTPITERWYYRIDTITHKTDESAPFYTNLSQKLPSEEDANAFPLLLRFYRSIERKLISDDDDVRVLYEDLSTDLEDKKLIRVPRDDTIGTCSTLVTDVLNDMDVPKDDHESILGEVVQGVDAFYKVPHHQLENVHALPDVVLLVDICDVTLQIAFTTPPQNQAYLCNY